MNKKETPLEDFGASHGSPDSGFDGTLTDAMLEGFKADYYLGPYADIVFGDSSKLMSRDVDRELPIHE